ncbi:hypothetical protein [Komagataeibacter nataicola]|uniref:hypothetical protein n=1 Tax=Komagataeibacter nataicola TaxID=265960 RepID=UPI0038D0843C
MTTLYDHIQMLCAELTSFHLSRRERRQIERELKEALARRDAEPPPDGGFFLVSPTVLSDRTGAA